MANPRVNKYYSSNSAEAKAYRKKKRETEPAPPTLNGTIRAAAALVAEHNAAAQAANGTLHRSYPKPKFAKPTESNSTLNKRSPSTEYWAANVEKNGLAPM